MHSQTTGGLHRVRLLLFGSKSFNFPTLPAALFPIDIKENKSVLKVGLNYKFGKAPVPVYSK